MNKQIRYTDIPIGGEPIGELKIITDSLPSPKELKFKSANTKVTISLSSESVAYFKAVAKANQMQYQKMIRQLPRCICCPRKSAHRVRQRTP